MPRRRRPDIPPSIVEFRGGALREPTTVVLHGNPGAEIVRPMRDLATRRPGKGSVLDTPGPWSKEFLEENGLRVVYRHGYAVLEEKR